MTCAAGDLNPEQEASFQIVVSVLSGYSGSIANTVHAESTETPGHPATPDPEPKNNKAEVEVSTLPSADLELVKTALTPEVHPGQQASFSLVMTNKGPSDAQEVKLVDTLPAGLAYVSSSGASCEAAGQTVTCALGTITAGSSVTVELVTQPAGSRAPTRTRPSVSSTTPDPDPGNNSSEATVKVVPVPAVTPVTPSTVATPRSSGVSPSSGSMARTRVTLRKLVREHEVAPGGRLDYRLIVRNAGVQTAEKLKVCDDLPEQTTVLCPRRRTPRRRAHLLHARDARRRPEPHLHARPARRFRRRRSDRQPRDGDRQELRSRPRAGVHPGTESELGSQPAKTMSPARRARAPGPAERRSAALSCRARSLAYATPSAGAAGAPLARAASAGPPTPARAWVAKVVYPTVARAAPRLTHVRRLFTVSPVSAWGAPTELLVLGSRVDAAGHPWLRVRLDYRPNGFAAWIDEEDTVMHRDPGGSRSRASAAR